jgi:hypothetical protein
LAPFSSVWKENTSDWVQTKNSKNKNMVENDEPVEVVAPKPFEIKRENGVVKVWIPKLKSWKVVTNYTFDIVAHAIQDGDDLYVMKCIQIQRLSGKAEWYLALLQSDADNKHDLYNRMCKQGVSVNEEYFKDGQVHDHVRTLMDNYRHLPDQDDAIIGGGQRKKEVILMAAPGFYYSKYLEGRIYITNETTKIAVDKTVNTQRMDRMEVIWTGPPSSKRKILIRSDFSILEKTLTQLKVLPKCNFLSFCAIMGWTTIVMNQKKVPNKYKINPAGLLGPASSGDLSLLLLDKLE